ncbi:MAG: hypothetical protein HKN41_07305 [Ilumatobacter sp.]|nr:hypothetical protein [Ilumatobacter sp.]
MSQPRRVGVRAVATTRTSLDVEFADGVVVRGNRFWLRDNCPLDVDRASLFRGTSVASLPDDLAIVGAELDDECVHVWYDDGVCDRVDPWELRARLTPMAAPGCVPWSAGFEPTCFDAARLAPESIEHHALLEAIARSACALVTGVAAHETEALAALLGPVRETDFGRVFDIVHEPQPFTPSQSADALDPHTDDPYRYSPAGISILHCVEPSAGTGGESIIVDGLAVAEMLREADPEAFEVLTSVRVPFVHRRSEPVERAGDVHLRAEAPIIALDGSGRVSGIRFHERSMGAVAVDTDEADRFYLALMRFARAVRSDTFAWRRYLAPGEAIVYDNQRVLHGRSGFEGAQTRRHLRLCTVDRDQVHSRLRRLRERYATGTEADPLPAGNLS